MERQTFMRSHAFWIAFFGVAACDRQAPKTEAGSSAEATQSAPAPSASATSTAIPQAPTSKVPSLEEWSRVGEVTVKGSSALSCETKMIREWFRVSCSGKNDTGGMPTTVRIVSGRQPGAHEYQVGGVASLVTPYFPGTHLEAVFSWTDKSHKLVLDWPKDAPKRPTILGVFEGAKSPLDRPKEPSKFRDAACKCERENPLFGVPDPDIDCDTIEVHDDCARAFASECRLYQRCAMGDPNTPPTCAAGHAPLFNRCAKVCSTDADCPSKDHVCLEMVEGAPKVCVN